VALVGQRIRCLDATLVSGWSSFLVPPVAVRRPDWRTQAGWARSVRRFRPRSPALNDDPAHKLRAAAARSPLPGAPADPDDIPND
jgi:hypothetical protein